MHPEIEQSWVLEGSFSDHDGICRKGEYVWRHSGSMHETYSEEGCTILAIYRKPNIFAKSAGFSTGKKVGEPDIGRTPRTSGSSNATGSTFKGERNDAT